MNEGNAARTTGVPANLALEWYRHTPRFRESLLTVLEMMAEHNYITTYELAAILGYRRKVIRYGQFLTCAGLVFSFDTASSESNAPPCYAHHARKAYCLSTKGHRFLAQLGRLRVRRRFHPAWYRYSSLRHTTACLQTRLYFTRHPAVREYFPERVLLDMDHKSADLSAPGAKSLLPDAEFTFHTTDNGGTNRWRGAVEVELSRKYHTRIEQKIVKYSGRPDLAVVVWVCGSDLIQSDIRKSVEKIRPAEPAMFRFILYSDLMRNGLSLARASDWTGRDLNGILA